MVVNCAQECGHVSFKYLSGKFRQDERGFVNFRVVIFKVHSFDFLF